MSHKRTIAYSTLPSMVISNASEKENLSESWI